MDAIFCEAKKYPPPIDALNKAAMNGELIIAGVIYRRRNIYTGRLSDPASMLTDSPFNCQHQIMARESRDRLQRLKVSTPVFQRPHQAAHDRGDPLNLDGQYSCWMAFSDLCICERC